MSVDRRSILAALALGAGATAVVSGKAEADSQPSHLSHFKLGNPDVSKQPLCLAFLAPSCESSKSLFREMEPILAVSPSQVQGFALLALPWFRSASEQKTLIDLAIANPDGFATEFAKVMLGGSVATSPATSIERELWAKDWSAFQQQIEMLWHRPTNAPDDPPVIANGVPYWGVGSLKVLRDVLARTGGRQ